MAEKGIAIRSKECIVQALFALMKKDDYEKLTISEIAAEARLDRRTFYRHFKKKEDIITYYLKTSAKEYETALQTHTLFDNWAIAESFFTVCLNQRTTLTLLLKHRLYHLLLEELSALFAFYQTKFAAPEELNHPQRDYMLTYHIGGFCKIMNQWLSYGCPESPAEMADIIQQMLETHQI